MIICIYKYSFVSITRTEHGKNQRFQGVNMTVLTLIPGKLTLEQLRQVYDQDVTIELVASAYEAIDASRKAVEAIIAKDKSAYGINTGFGLLAKTRISDDELELLQRNLILSHSVGTGERLPDNVVRLIMVMKLSLIHI